LFSFFFKETLQAFTPARYSFLIDLPQTFTEKNFNKKADNLSDYRLSLFSCAFLLTKYLDI